MGRPMIISYIHLFHKNPSKPSVRLYCQLMQSVNGRVLRQYPTVLCATDRIVIKATSHRVSIPSQDMSRSDLHPMTAFSTPSSPSIIDSRLWARHSAESELNKNKWKNRMQKLLRRASWIYTEDCAKAWWLKKNH